MKPEKIKDIKLYLFDMDGTLYLGEQLYDFTKELLSKIRQVGSDYMFMTNNSSKSVVDYIKKLDRLRVTLKDSFARIRYISKELCRILYLWTQMQCLSGKLIRHR